MEPLSTPRTEATADIEQDSGHGEGRYHRSRRGRAGHRPVPAVGRSLHRAGRARRDNTTFRLGDDLSMRFPSADRYVAQVDKEHRWLPILARHLPLAIPEPVAMGQPGSGFPRPWSIYRWIDGDPASVGRIADVTAFASDLAVFLAALYAIDASDGPAPGKHNFFRGGPLDTFDAQSRKSIQLLADEIDCDGATEVWEAALASTWDRSPVWMHGDVAASNLLVADGSLRAVIDFGCAAVGDPACDLVMAWSSSPMKVERGFEAVFGSTMPPGYAGVDGHSGRRSSRSRRRSGQERTPTTLRAGGDGEADLARSSNELSPTTAIDTLHAGRASPRPIIAYSAVWARADACGGMGGNRGIAIRLDPGSRLLRHRRWARCEGSQRREGTRRPPLCPVRGRSTGRYRWPTRQR